MPDDPDINPDEQPEEQKPEKPGNQQEEVAEFIAGVVDRRITAALQTTIPQMIQASIEGAIPKIVEGKLSKSLGPVVQPAPSVQTNGVVASPQVPEVVQAAAPAAVTGLLGGIDMASIGQLLSTLMETAGQWKMLTRKDDYSTVAEIAKRNPVALMPYTPGPAGSVRPTGRDPLPHAPDTLLVERTDGSGRLG